MESAGGGGGVKAIGKRLRRLWITPREEQKRRQGCKAVCGWKQIIKRQTSDTRQNNKTTLMDNERDEMRDEGNDVREENRQIADENRKTRAKEIKVGKVGDKRRRKSCREKLNCCG